MLHTSVCGALLAAERMAMFAAVEAVVNPWSETFGQWTASLGKAVTFRGETAETVLLRHLMGKPMEGCWRRRRAL